MASEAEVKKLVITAIERCLAMQAEHMSALKSGCLNKINQWLEERQAMVTRLRQAMANVHPTEVDPAFRELLLERIGSILDREKLLYSIAEEQRNGISEQLTSMRVGKRALHGYGPTLSNRPPQFVSGKR